MGRLVTAWWIPLFIGLMLVALINTWTPNPDADHRISWVEGDLGEPTSTARLTVRAQDVQMAREMSTSRFSDETVRTEHVLVAVGLEVDVREQASNLVDIAFYSRDKIYYDVRIESGLPLEQAPAGFTSIGTAVFLVPVDQLKGGRLRITPSSRRPINHDTGVSIDLGIDDAAAAVAEADAADVLKPPAPTVVVT